MLYFSLMIRGKTFKSYLSNINLNIGKHWRGTQRSVWISVISHPSVPSCSSTYLYMKFPIQKYVLCLQIMMQEGRIHVVEKIYPQRDLIENPESQRPAKSWVDVLLQEEIKGKLGSINNPVRCVATVYSKLETEHVLGLAQIQKQL